MHQAGFIIVARRWWPVILLAAIVTGVTAYVAASRVPPTYEAQVTLLTGPINTDFATLRASGDLARTYAELATSGPVLAGAIQQLRLDTTAEKLRLSVRATSNDVTRLVRIRVRDTDGAKAARIANELARRMTGLTQRVPREAVDLVDGLLRQPEIAGLTPETQRQIETAAGRLLRQPLQGRLEIVDPAIQPVVPVAPRVSLITLLATLAGLVGASILVLIKEFSSDTVEGEEDLAELTSLPLLGSIGPLRRRLPVQERGVVVESAPASAPANDYRLLATRIGFLDGDADEARTILVVGSDEKDGGGTVAANLATVLAAGNQRVTLVDANEAQPEVTRLFGLNGEPGYGELVSREENVNGVGVERSEGLFVLPRGGVSDELLLDVPRARKALEHLLGESDRVVLAAPSVESSQSTLVWAHVADATVLVVRRGKSKRDTVSEAVQALRLSGARIAGSVIRDGRAAR